MNFTILRTTNYILIFGPGVDTSEDGNDVIPEEVNLSHDGLLQWLVQVSLQSSNKSIFILHQHPFNKYQYKHKFTTNHVKPVKSFELLHPPSNILSFP